MLWLLAGCSWGILAVFSSVLLEGTSGYGLGSCPRIGYMSDFDISADSLGCRFTPNNQGDPTPRSLILKAHNMTAALCCWIDQLQHSGLVWLCRDNFTSGATVSATKYDIQFTGRWYEIERSFYFMELISSCVSVDLDENNKGLLDVYVNSKSRVSGIFSISEGVAISTKKDPSLLLYKVSSKLPRFINRYLPGAGYYQVVKTDYKRFAILYSCTNFHLFHTDLVWIWARKKEIDVNLRTYIYHILSKNRIDPERLTLPKNKNCTDDY